MDSMAVFTAVNETRTANIRCIHAVHGKRPAKRTPCHGHLGFYGTESLVRTSTKRKDAEKPSQTSGLWLSLMSFKKMLPNFESQSHPRAEQSRQTFSIISAVWPA